MRRRVAVGAALVAALLLWLLASDRFSVGGAGPMEGSTAREAPAPVQSGTGRARARRSDGPTALIEDLRTEAETICVGDQVLAEVRLGQDGEAAKVFVNGKPGVIHLLRGRRAGPLAVRAMAQLGEREELRERTVEVEECPERPRLVVRSLDSSAEAAERIFEVESLTGLSEPIDLSWRFADGTILEGPQRRVRHSFAMREQVGPTSTELVHVAARGAQGRTAETRVAVTLVNSHWIVSQGPEPELPMRVLGFAELVEETLVTEIELRNIDRSRGARFRSARLRASPCRDLRDVQERVVDVGSIATVGSVPPNEIESGRLTIPTALFPEPVCQWEVALQGRFDDDTPVLARASVSVGAPAGSQPVAQRARAMASLRAMVDRQRNQVTIEEVREQMSEGERREPVGASSRPPGEPTPGGAAPR